MAIWIPGDVMLTDLAAWILGIYLIVSGCCFLRLQKLAPAIAQALAWAQGSIAAGAALIGLAVRHPGVSHWQTAAVAVGGFIAAGTLISGLLKAMPGPAAIARQYTNTLPALAALVATLTCGLLAAFAPLNVEGAALGLLGVFAAVAARISMTIAYRDFLRSCYWSGSAFSVQALACGWLGIAFLSPAATRLQMGLSAGALLALTLGWVVAQRLADHLQLAKGGALAAGLPNQQQIDGFLSDYFRHKQPEGVILLKFAMVTTYGDAIARDEHTPDALFRDVGSVLQKNFRADDFVAAAAGRQFLVACPGLQPDIAQALAERACQAVKRASLYDQHGDAIEVTLLVGASSICETLPDCERGWRQADGELSGSLPAVV